jgi:hypothetical protein
MPVVKQQPEYSAAFRELMREVGVPLVHLAPKHTASISATITADTSDSMRGLADAYKVMPRDIIRAALVIGLETLLYSAEELGHGPQKTTD